MSSRWSFIIRDFAVCSDLVERRRLASLTKKKNQTKEPKPIACEHKFLENGYCSICDISLARWNAMKHAAGLKPKDIDHDNE